MSRVQCAEETAGCTRRRFLGDLVRLGAAAAAVGGIGALIARRGDRCRADVFCRDCAAFAGCALPAALKARAGGRR